MADSFMYGVIQYSGALPGDSVRFVHPLNVSTPGAVFKPKSPKEVNAVLHSVNGSVGYCKLTPIRKSLGTAAGSGTASGVVIKLPITAGGGLKIN